MTIDECARIEELISAQQDGAATPEERAQIERHVAGCARCQATVAAFGKVDRQVRRYLMATPVPEIAAPWRHEPAPLPARRVGSLGHWRATTVGLAAIFALIFTASILAFQPFTTDAPQSANFVRSTAEAASDRGAPGAAQVAATSTPNPAAAIVAAPAAPVQPTAASAAARSGAAATAQAQTAGGSTAGGAPPASTRQPAAMAAPASEAAVNPAQLLRLSEATELRICRPAAGWCDAQPRTPEEQATIVAALDRPLQRLAPPSASGSDQVVVLTFRFATGEERVLSYHYPTGRLTLPGNVEVQGSPELATALGGITAPR
jgi:anti-sigma factor RsiW